MNISKSIYLLSLVLIPPQLYSQNMWTKVYGGKGHDDGRAVIRAHDNGYLFVCTTQSFGHGSVDIWLIKTNEFGDTLWTKTFGGGKIDAAEHPNCIIRTSDNGYIITGSTESFGEGDFDLYLIKIDSGVNRLWEKTYGTNQREDGHMLINTTDNNYVVLGSKMTASGNYDLWLVKFDIHGEIIWEKTYGGPSYDFGYCLINDYADGYIIAGSQTTASGKEFIWLLKTNAIGDTLWTKRLSEGEENQYQRAHSIHLNNDNGYSVLCHVINEQGESYQYFIKTSMSGEITASKTFKEQMEFNRIDIYSAEITHDNGFILIGEIGTPYSFISDLILIKLDSDFDVLWKRVSQNNNNMNWVTGLAVRECDDLGFVISGWFANDVLMMKTDSVGNFLMPIYSGIARESKNRPTFSISQNYPNPFNSSTRIEYFMPISGYLEITLMDLLGREIRTLISDYKTSGSHQVFWNGLDSYGAPVASGVYFYNMTAYGFNETRKLLLLR